MLLSCYCHASGRGGRDPHTDMRCLRTFGGELNSPVASALNKVLTVNSTVSANIWGGVEFSSGECA
eukprot:1573324-Pyramimonas_sp.AAC.1